MNNLVNEKERVNEALRYSHNDLKRKRSHWLVLLVGITLISFLAGMMAMLWIIRDFGYLK